MHMLYFTHAYVYINPLMPVVQKIGILTLVLSNWQKHI